MVRYIKLTRGNLAGLGIGFSRSASVAPLPQATQVNPLPVAQRFGSNTIYPEREEVYDVMMQSPREVYLEGYEDAIAKLTRILRTSRSKQSRQEKVLNNRLINEVERKMWDLWGQFDTDVADESGRQLIMRLIEQARSRNR